MCWLTLSASSHNKRHPPSPCHDGPRVITISTAPEISHRHRHVRIVVPTTAFTSDHDHKHRHHYRSHPRPDTLRGRGIKRAGPPPPPPPPSPLGKGVRFAPDLDPSRFEWPFISEPLPKAPRSTEHASLNLPVYASPPSTGPPGDIRLATREALRSRDGRPPGRLRRVAGYEVLTSDVPWTWDCVDARTRRMKRGERLNYPPFGPTSGWR